MRTCGRYDLNFDLGERLSRVQCKWAPLRGDVVFVNAYSSRRTANGLLKRRYLSCEIDAIAAYCSDLDRCSHVPAWYLETRLQLSLRLPPCRNNQAAGVNWADAFGFEHLQ